MAPPGNHHRYYPEVKSPLRRQVHAPSPVRKFGLSCPRQVVSGNAVGVLLTSDCNSLERKKLDLPLDYYRTEVVDVDDYDDEVDYVEVISDDDEVENAVDMEEESEKEVSLDEVNPKNGSFMVVDEEAVTDDVCSFEAYRKALKSAENRTSKLKARGFGGFLRERCRGLLRSLRSFFRQDEEPDVRSEPFEPLSKEELTAVKDAFSANFHNILVSHENSNIDITVEKLRCLKPGQWLNDEVINLYLVLLKEREAREPKKFLKCHFFNTFFFTKLVNSATGYNYNAVRRWTSMKKLGYHLIDCDKIFIPIHMNIHWTLAVINIKERKFQYLDSYKGREPRILDALGRYFVDEVRDKNEVDVDVSQWRQEFVQDLPEQSNGFDCGMFMLKYMDFYSRGLDLCFTEEHMAYFRVRTAKEILQLRAE
ncbi:PREDICTED: ubiquitin-like-specific protease 1A isoform X2 [Brassica oleracea var. oleracea]|uniref:ubiquitin-like-specific protease 1A isoform X2 n=1 Tax=Brassica oleracea var. oleracea TaxID=109376 RepID=UPI0006A706E6|nr:PREDICTED: ubiquitin-like-specific protease 1A isoform X2 [Brassica oleracea var. oleracea]